MATDLSRSNFKQRVTFKTVAKVQDASGGYTEPYSTLLSTWAVVISKGGTRMLNEGTDYVVDRKDMYVTYRSALDVIDKDSRIVYEGKWYAIQAQNFVDETNDIIKFETVQS